MTSTERSGMEGPAPRALVVDDEDAIVEFVRMGLGYEGFEVEVASGGNEALARFHAFAPHVVVLDRMLPDLDGLEVCRKIRQASDVPIIMLTARGELEDRVEGLETGADDYLPKPFKFPELLARVRALLRRAGMGTTGRVLRFEDLEMDLATRRVCRDGRPVELTQREFDLLEMFMRRPRHVVRRDQIMARLWGWDASGDTNVVEVHVSALRSKLGDSERRLIRTVRGVGYAVGG